MATNGTLETKNDKILKILLIALVVVFVLGGVGYYIARTSITKEQVTAHLNAFANAVEKYGAARGYNAKFTYASATVEGSIFRRKAVVSEPQIVIAPQAAEESERTVTIRTPVLELMPKSTDFMEVKAVLPQPLNIARATRQLEVSYAEPLAFTVERESDEEGTAASYNSDLPSSIRIADNQQHAVELSFGQKSTLFGVVNFAAATYNHEVQLNQLRFEGGELSFAANSLDATIESGTQDNRQLRHQNINVDHLLFEGKKAALGPLNINADMESELSAAAQPGSPQPMHVNVNDFTIENADNAFSLKTSGQLTRTPGEFVPQGELNTVVAKPEELLAALQQAELSNPIFSQVALLIFGKIDPTWKPGGEELKFTLKHHPNESVYVGPLTFEELTAQTLGGLIQQALPNGVPSTAVPNAPATEGTAPMVPSLPSGSPTVPAEPAPVTPSPAQGSAVPAPHQNEAGENAVPMQGLSERIEEKLRQLQQTPPPSPTTTPTTETPPGATAPATPPATGAATGE